MKQYHLKKKDSMFASLYNFPKIVYKLPISVSWWLMSKVINDNHKKEVSQFIWKGYLNDQLHTSIMIEIKGVWISLSKAVLKPLEACLDYLKAYANLNRCVYLKECLDYLKWYVSTEECLDHLKGVCQ